MRNIFDQYKQPENRLTHALVCCLHEDDALKRDFVEWLIGRAVPEGHLHIAEQSLPGQPSEDEDGVRDSLPDAWIFSDDGWSLLIESKVQAPVDTDQLQSHQSMARKYGYDDATVCLISAKPTTIELPANVVHRLWPEVYEWLHIRQRQSEWARRMVDYMEVLEAKMTATEYLTEGSLTTFTGLRFDDEDGYLPLQAKRLLKLAMQEIRNSERLRQIGVDPMLPGRGRIPENDVWDCVRLQGIGSSGQFNEQPHFTLGLPPEGVLAVLIIPNRWLAVGAHRQAIKQLGYETFLDKITDVTRRLTEVLGSSTQARPWILVQQRRATKGQRLDVWDARLEFDPQTATGLLTDDHAGRPLKPQHEWLEATYRALTNKNANLEMCLGGRMQYNYAGVQSREFLDRVINSWAACQPLLAAICPGR